MIAAIHGRPGGILVLGEPAAISTQGVMIAVLRGLLTIAGILWASTASPD